MIGLYQLDDPTSRINCRKFGGKCGGSRYLNRIKKIALTLELYPIKDTSGIVENGGLSQ